MARKGVIHKKVKPAKKKAPLPKLKIMVASTVYNFQDSLNQICAILNRSGFTVINSHLGTMKVDPRKSNLENCLAAVEDCDLLFGIVRPFYGSGVINGKSITHCEISKAIELDKPRWFVTHGDVTLARQLLQQYRYRGKYRNRKFRFKKTSVMDSIKVIDLYDEIVKSNVAPGKRRGNWNQEYHTLEDILRYLETQFSDMERVRAIINDMK